MVLFTNEAPLLTIMSAVVLMIDDAPIKLEAPSQAGEIQKALEVDPLACSQRPSLSTKRHEDASFQ